MTLKLRQVVGRCLAWFARFNRCVDNFTLGSTIPIFLFRNTPREPRRAVFRHQAGYFLYRGYSDYGVMAHFYEEGYAIRSETQEAIQWIFDCGANIGDETVKFALRHPSAKILAVEPQSGNCSLLRRNVEQFGSRVIVTQAGIWPKDSRLRVVSGRTNEGFTVVEDASGSIEGRSIASLMQELEADRIDILKLDCEGAEYGLFCGAPETWISRVNCIIMEVADHEMPGTMQAMFTALAEQGLSFNFHICGENIVGIRKGAPLRLTRTHRL